MGGRGRAGGRGGWLGRPGGGGTTVRPGLEAHIRPYRNGRDLAAKPRGLLVIDLFGLTEEVVRLRYPEVYQALMATVRTKRSEQFAKSATKDRSEEHTSELQSLMRISYAVFCLKKKT